MLNDKQIERFLGKMGAFIERMEPHIFVKVGELENVEKCHVNERYHKEPDLPFTKAEKGEYWEGEGTYCWFRGEFNVPEELAGKTLFIKPHIGGYEALLFVNGKPFGTFASKIVVTAHGNHYCDMVKFDPAAGEKLNIALEYYAGHFVPGCMPFENTGRTEFKFRYDGADICVKDYEVQEFYFDLKTLYQMTEALPENSFGRAKAVNALLKVYENIPTATDDVPFSEVVEALRTVKSVIKEALSAKNGDNAPEAAIIGHSHMDTAWLWHVGETVKKCARTYANQISLMQQYPEYKFIQSSACHGDMIRKYYPELFEDIKKAVAEGRYEPNGGVWVECDCNITSGESMIRQFLWGQRFTRKHFGYTSNCFWLPDTFGYSAAIPQIMKGCAVDYFLTTKISWNDTNEFPYDTFYWQGIDGTKVFTHFNTTHHHPNVCDVSANINGGIKQKGVTDKRMLTFGFGDGGGGPQFEMIEMARRIEDLDGVPKTRYSRVGDFMQELEKDCVNPNTYRGELYLELHRGTLTNQHTIKRNNRKSENALRDLEIMTVNDAVRNDKVADSSDIAPLYETLLINQFHDILPGTCINKAHLESRAQTTALIKEAKEKTAMLIKGNDDNTVTVINTLSFERNDVLFLDIPEGLVVEGRYNQQRYTDLDGKNILLVSGVKIPAFSSVTLNLVENTENRFNCNFIREGNKLSAPFYEVTLAENGTISEYFDKRAGRQIVCGENFNTLLVAEDVPASWDNWDVDSDYELKFKNASKLVSSEIVSVGRVAYIIRNKYQITANSTVTQDMMFFAHSAEIRFDTVIDWNDNHKFLKAAFDTDIFDDFARHEIQFGYAKRPTTRNTSVEQAKFEVLNHKYSDISEARYGFAVLNDCKYGISAKDGSLRLSLHKGGNRPDHEGDRDGLHRCVYSVLPHEGSFGTENVIKPAYMLNIPVIQTKGTTEVAPLIRLAADNCIVEAIKPCEDAEKAFIVRVYEAEGAYTKTAVEFFDGMKKAALTNMLEEEIAEIGTNKKTELVFKPFEIKTVKVYY
ncbi:MAG: alpha-mannosidase [Ruminococcaceae bacterium]|nr:alpha-mannosidase [Oscillospiraceae bacterium]